VKKKLDEVKKVQASSANVATDNQDSCPNFEVHELPCMKTGRHKMNWMIRCKSISETCASVERQ